ncbi:hypothetical protein [Candidatus Nitrososphaera evergladensis]|uniref:hypothetical protein n=1 Tax=Candidatus Nitrososphaera evergladensis TaxID=1459637 RepID=UPI0011E5C651|nr:hypothetical protein [Candidatus Nitrososphaera evergladensis]
MPSAPQPGHLSMRVAGPSPEAHQRHELQTRKLARAKGFSRAAVDDLLTKAGGLSSAAVVVTTILLSSQPDAHVELININ